MLTPIGQITFQDVLDIALVTFLIYQGYLLVAGTRAFNVVRGILVFATVWGAAQLLGLTTLSTLLGRAGTVGLFALVVLFQPELRAALERVGRPRGREGTDGSAVLQTLARAMERLAERKTGALIAIERKTPLGEYAATGVTLDAVVSVPFLEALFARNAPLHDGGVIIQGARVVAAGCLFPLQSSDGTYRRYGTRHRAAIGLSELTDAVVLVVSEERGSMRVALGGKLGPDLNGAELREQLRRLVYEAQIGTDDLDAVDPEPFPTLERGPERAVERPAADAPEGTPGATKAAVRAGERP
ncbi:diadenylate cyclase CdaA [Deinococcus ficus]|jgi:diadenylate cyclase|uniref:diadenylate cyclase CdaA n=1 Tax=Deinococcus ficus TaxID=317577 RepID=UPI00040572E1|nr:diadenylate cyclase CdaA [Deinococcus ficus]GHF84183.1 TIGR00159 family protein [Deinococcus ficus]